MAEASERRRSSVSSLPLSALNISIRDVICHALDPLLIRETPDHLHRDYRGIPEQIVSFNAKVVLEAERSKQPTDYLLTIMAGLDYTLGDLFKMLEKIGRYDVLDDLSPMLDNRFLKRNLSQEVKFSLKLVTRNDWGAKPAREDTLKPFQLAHPINLVFLDHTTEEGFTDTIELVQKLQKQSMESKGAYDMDCNFLIDKDGVVYEGASWYLECGHGFRYSKMALVITLIGINDTTEPEEEKMAGIEKLIQYGVEKGYIEPDYGVYGMCYANKSSGPGEKVMDKIKKWHQFEAFGDLEHKM